MTVLLIQESENWYNRHPQQQQQEAMCNCSSRIDTLSYFQGIRHLLSSFKISWYCAAIHIYVIALERFQCCSEHTFFRKNR